MSTAMTDPAENIHVILSGGDTGGHLYLAVAIIEYLRKCAPSSTLSFAGAPGRLPMGDALPPDVPAFSLNVLPFDRKKSLRNLKVFFATVRGIRESLRIFSAGRPDAVVGLGGYPSGPFLYAATLKKIPTLIMEPNVKLGLANRLLAKRVDRICVAFDETAACFPRGAALITGTPVRETLTRSLPDKARSRALLGMRPDMRTCLVIGGSLGSGRLNDALLHSVGELTGRNIQILWQTGHEQFQAVNSMLGGSCPRACSVVPFIEDMAQAYAAADLVVSAGGAITIAELAVAGTPAIIIPSADVTGNHQYYNALALEREQACLLIKEQDIDGKLPGAIIGLLGSPERLDAMRGCIRRFARPQAAELVANEILKLCGRRTGML